MGRNVLRLFASRAPYTNKCDKAPTIYAVWGGGATPQQTLIHGGVDPPADGSGMTIRIRYRIPNARLAAGAVNAGQGGGVDQAYDGWRVVSQFPV